MGCFDSFTNGIATATPGNTIVHTLGDADTPQRVLMTYSPGDTIALFSCECRAAFNARSMTTPQLALFLARNGESSYGQWHLKIDDGQVTASMRYLALADGLDASRIKVICGELLKEVAFVEEALHSQGML